MDSDEEQIVAAATCVIFSSALLLKRKMERKRKKRRWWMLSLNRSRSRYSFDLNKLIVIRFVLRRQKKVRASEIVVKPDDNCLKHSSSDFNQYNASNMLQDLNQEPSGKFENFCRMSAVDFEYILNRIGPLITKNDTVMRKAIPPKERLAVTLRFLASGDSFVSLSFLFKLSNQVISDIVHEVCQAIITTLKEEIKMPQTMEEWTNLSKEYYDKWNFPNCIGSLDGKHVVLSSPFNSGSEFINYKGTFSIVMMALVDANYCFSYVDIGCQGRISDGGVFRNTSLFKKLEEGELNVPLPHPISSNGPPVPYVIVADDAFSLSEYLMKPYPGTHEKGSKERHFNYRLSRARRIVENVFGIMSAIFRVLRKPMLLNPEKASNVVMACSLLHNFLRKSRTSSARYTPPGTFDSEHDGQIVQGTWRQDIETASSLLPLQNIPNKSEKYSPNILQQLENYHGRTHMIINNT